MNIEPAIVTKHIKTLAPYCVGTITLAALYKCVVNSFEKSYQLDVQTEAIQHIDTGILEVLWQLQATSTHNLKGYHDMLVQSIDRLLYLEMVLLKHDVQPQLQDSVLAVQYYDDFQHSAAGLQQLAKATMTPKNIAKTDIRLERLVEYVDKHMVNIFHLTDDTF